MVIALVLSVYTIISIVYTIAVFKRDSARYREYQRHSLQEELDAQRESRKHTESAADPSLSEQASTIAQIEQFPLRRQINN